MRRASLAMTLALAACGPQVTPDEPTRTGPWWLGNWQVDLAALEAQTDFAALTPEAQAFARGALEAGPWRLGLDSTRVHLSDGRTLACSFETTGDDAVVVTVDDTVLLRLRRTGPRTMRTEGDLPLVRAE